MGVYIKGMEMPTSCRACLYSRTDIRNVDWCVLTEKDLPCDCPLVPVQPHGRLIDAGELFKEMERKGWFDNADRDIAEDLVLAAPTIIQAKEGE